MAQYKPRIGNNTVWLMIGVAAVYDSLQVISDIAIIGLILGTLISIFAFLTFWLWFKLKGISLAGLKKSLVMGIFSFLEIIPLINDIPGWILSTIIIIIISRTEDRLLSEEKQQQLDALLKGLKNRDLSQLKNNATRMKNVVKYRSRPQVDSIRQSSQ